MSRARAAGYAFVDLETTGMSPAHARVTEIAVVRVEPDGNTREWTTLLNPGRSIPREISYLTGIDDAMVSAAPRFADIAEELRGWLDDAVFVAHNARFDYAFLKAEYARLGAAFEAATLCTARLSRLLYPERSPHTLDAIAGRPSLPVHLPPDALDAIPHASGVYLFYGLNPHPIYIGKSVDLRTRVGSHFTNDHRSERALRLAQEVRRIEWERTAGAFGAELREMALIRERMPAHNVLLRRQDSQVVCTTTEDGRMAVRDARLLDTLLDADDHAGFCAHFGPFSSRASARRAVAAAAGEAGYCLATLGLEKRGQPDAPCFNRQIGRCAGACVGAEDPAANAARLHAAFAPAHLPRWPYPEPVHVVEETDVSAGLTGWQVFDRWRWLGTAETHAGLQTLIEAAPRVLRFEPLKLLARRLADAGAAPD